jgi:hypothetical protein
VSNLFSNTVSVWLGNGDGTFGRKTDFGTGGEPQSLVIEDLKGDGRPDLAVANASSNTVSVLLGRGNGTFGTKTDFGTGTQPTRVAIADLNADGRPDLAVANATSNTVSVLLNIGTGTTGVVPPPPPIPLAFRLLAPTPNPSRGTSEIRFVLPSARSVAVDVFDVSGRHLWSWASSAEMPAGPHAVNWNGRDGSGAAAGSGVYWLKLRAGRDWGVRKLVLQR